MIKHAMEKNSTLSDTLGSFKILLGKVADHILNFPLIHMQVVKTILWQDSSVQTQVLTSNSSDLNLRNILSLPKKIIKIKTKKDELRNEMHSVTYSRLVLKIPLSLVASPIWQNPFFDYGFKSIIISISSYLFLSSLFHFIHSIIFFTFSLLHIHVWLITNSYFAVIMNILIDLYRFPSCLCLSM